MVQFGHWMLPRFLSGACILWLFVGASPATPGVDWKANWVWPGGDPKPVNYYFYVRKVFDLPTGVTEIKARVCGVQGPASAF